MSLLKLIINSIIDTSNQTGQIFILLKKIIRIDKQQVFFEHTHSESILKQESLLQKIQFLAQREQIHFL